MQPPNSLTGFAEPVITIGALVIYPERYHARIHQHALKLTVSEFRILLMLARQAHGVVRREDLKDCLRGEQGPATDRALDNTVSRLRQKIELWQFRIAAVRGVGYQLADGQSSLS